MRAHGKIGLLNREGFQVQSDGVGDTAEAVSVLPWKGAVCAWDGWIFCSGVHVCCLFQMEVVFTQGIIYSF